MTVLNFPANPAVNDTYTENGVTYTWNGTFWEAAAVGGGLPPQIDVDPAGPEPTMTLDADGRVLVGTNSAVGGIGAGARLQVRGNTSAAGAKLSWQRDQAASSIGVGEEIGQLVFSSSDGGDYALVTARSDGASSSTSDCPGRLEFSTTADGAPSPTERLRITNDGTLQLRNSPGIDFSQIQTNLAGMTSETLDSYEEGTWTPTIFIGTAATPVATYSVQVGRYRKIGSMVVAMCNVGVNADQTGGNTGNLLVGGLPFTATALNIATTVHSEGLTNLTTQSLMFQLDSGLTHVALRSFTNGTFSPLTHSNIQGSGYQGFNFVATYLV